MNRLFKIFNADGEVTRFVPLELEINRHTKRINAVVTDSNSIDIFLEYNWLVKHNLDVNWEKKTIQFIRLSQNELLTYL